MKQKEDFPDRADFVIITALEKEAKAVVKLLDNVEIKRYQEKDIRTYRVGSIPTQDKSLSYRAVVVLLPNMGEISAATAVTDALTHWNPDFVFMLGIAGGIPQNGLDLGDVVIADQVVGYDYGKVTDETIKPRDHVYPASALLLDRIRNFWDDGWTKEIQTPRPKNASRPISKRFVGPIASGNKIIASTTFRTQLTARWPKLIAVETEAEGVFAAVFDRPHIKGTLVVRGICDMADERKGDEWQEYAADAAATFLINFLKTGPIESSVAIPTAHSSSVPPKVSLAKLPSTDPTLFGREEMLAELDNAWENEHANVVSLVAWGGVGKTALVNKWLTQMGAENYRGAECVYGWSFYSQGAAEGRQVSADQFIAAALTWFGDTDPKQGSPWDKGERLAELVKKQRTLLILDGLEPLQNPPPVETGRIKDQGLTSLLRELAVQNPGLVVISTRLAVDDLIGFRGSTAMEKDLENLSPEAGATYLKYLGVKGTDEERKQAAKDFDGHALALTLLGRYLADIHNGDIRKRDLVPKLTGEEKQGAHAIRIMQAYEKWFTGKPERDLLYIMGLFDRPVPKGAIDVLLVAPVIKGLTDKLQSLPMEEFKLVFKHLRQVRLLAEEDQLEPDTLDCHPLLREYFGEKLKENSPEAWREAHRRLYEYYKTIARELPETLEEMAPLFAAVMHGCKAGKHQEALEVVYWERIARGQEYFIVKKLGAIGAYLSVISNFFDPAWRNPVSTLHENVKGFVLGEAGFSLRALGRLEEATQPMHAALDMSFPMKDWKNASIRAGNLSEIYLTIGDIDSALNYARLSVELADQSGVAFERMVNRTTVADVLHQAGHLAEAETLFCEAEEMQKCLHPQFPLLYSLGCYQYCDYLLSLGNYLEVQRRGKKMFEWRLPTDSVLDVALNNLSFGRAHLLQSEREPGHPFTEAAICLNSAVDGLRKSGTMHELPRGLLARAELYRVMGGPEKAQKDLNEAFSIATRCGMGLYLADCHLEYARLYLAKKDKPKAREHWQTAREKIEKMGYHRRDKEVEELEKELM